MAEFDDPDTDEPLDLAEFPRDEGEPEGAAPADVGFPDEDDDEETETPAIRRLREYSKTLEHQLREARRAPVIPDNDPEPPAAQEPGDLASFDYDEDKSKAAWRAHEIGRAH